MTITWTQATKTFSGYLNGNTAVVYQYTIPQNFVAFQMQSTGTLCIGSKAVANADYTQQIAPMASFVLAKRILTATEIQILATV